MLDGAGVPPCVNLLGFDPTKLESGAQPPEPDIRYLAARRGRRGLAARPRPATAVGSDKESEVTLARQALAALRRAAGRRAAGPCHRAA